ncbi:hypothetical protein VaNZ11_008684, partial [Volvox africanus]
TGCDRHEDARVHRGIQCSGVSTGGGSTAAAALPVAGADDGGPIVLETDSDDAEDAESKAVRLGRPSAAAAAAAAKQHATGEGKKARKGGNSTTHWGIGGLPPTVASEADLDSAYAGGLRIFVSSKVALMLAWSWQQYGKAVAAALSSSKMQTPSVGQAVQPPACARLPYLLANPLGFSGALLHIRHL